MIKIDDPIDRPNSWWWCLLTFFCGAAEVARMEKEVKEKRKKQYDKLTAA